jgi:MYXO-CTERM domain-containing protein
MGDAWESRDARFVWSAYGTTEIAQVRLMASAVGAAEREFEWGRWTPNALDATGEAVVPWGPRELAVWLEVTQVDREVGWTSPVYLERAAPPEPSGCQSVPFLVLPGLGLLAALRRRKRG